MHYLIMTKTLFSGIDGWPGEQLHSHNYRDPEPFRGKVHSDCCISMSIH